eukprot:COSAG05_NODE_491_length_9309_cov_621.580726_5_plen_55_part_00
MSMEQLNPCTESGFREHAMVGFGLIDVLDTVPLYGHVILVLAVLGAAFNLLGVK